MTYRTLTLKLDTLNSKPVFLASAATAVVPTVAAVVAVYATIVIARGTTYGGDEANFLLSVRDAASLITLMTCSGMSMCAIARWEECRSRDNFVKEFRRRCEQRRWAALISNMLPPAVVNVLHKKSNIIASRRRTRDGKDNKVSGKVDAADAAGDAEADEDELGATKLAWNLPHTCIFQSDIVGFTSLTQRIKPRELVAMLHALFAAYDKICTKHQVQKIETIGDAYLAATGAADRSQTGGVDVDSCSDGHSHSPPKTIVWPIVWIL
jgi:hypothetical protein